MSPKPSSSQRRTTANNRLTTPTPTNQPSSQSPGDGSGTGSSSQNIGQDTPSRTRGGRKRRLSPTEAEELDKHYAAVLKDNKAERLTDNGYLDDIRSAVKKLERLKKLPRRKVLNPPGSVPAPVEAEITKRREDHGSRRAAMLRALKAELEIFEKGDESTGHDLRIALLRHTTFLPD